MKQRMISLLGLLMLSLLLSPVCVRATEAGTVDTERYHAVCVDEDPRGYDFYDTCTEDVFSGLNMNRKSRSAGTADTGLYGSQLTGIAGEIYEALSETLLGPEQNGISKTHSFVADETAQEVFDDYRAVYAAALYAYGRDRHDLFLWWSNNKVGIKATYNSSQITMSFYYTVSDYYTEDLQNAATDRINSLVQACTGYNRETRLRYYHDWIVNNNDYDTPTSRIEEEDDPEAFYYAHTAVGCLLKGKGVCESYSKLLKIFCLRENIPCLIVTSESHAWNYVKMEDDNWYMIDVTWDDPIGGTGVYNTYYLVSNEPNIDSDHTVDQRFVYPSTSGKAFSIDHDYRLTGRTVSTCVTPGIETYTCSHCGDVKTCDLPVDPSSHTGNINYENRQDASCGKEGYTGDKHCKDCGELLEIGENIPATGKHVFTGEGVITKEPTYSETGEKMVTCVVCGYEKTEEIPVLSLPVISKIIFENTSTGIRISWAKVNSAEGYAIYRKTGSGSYQKIAKIGKPGTLSYTDTGVNKKNGSLITYAVCACHGSAEGAKKPRSTLRLTGTSLVSVKNNAARSMKARWKKNNQAAGYQLQYALDASFAKGTKTLTIKKAGTLTKAVKKLKKGKKYYVKIRTYKVYNAITGYSAWSGSKTVKIRK